MTEVTVRRTRSDTPAATQVTWYLNVNYVCNERCTFCAAGLANGPLRTPGRPKGLTRDDGVRWLDGKVPAATDKVEIAGGEPTLHPDLLGLLRLLTPNRPATILFTNALRLVDDATAESILAAGVTDVQVAFFGPDAASHEAVTRRDATFARTLTAVESLNRLKAGSGATVTIRLLVSRATAPLMPATVRMLAERVPGIDRVSINRLILSEEADAAGAAVRWGDARDAINETAALVLAAGWTLGYEAVPLCQFDGAVAGWVARAADERLAGLAVRPGRRFRYLDPYVAAGLPVPGASSRVPLATPAPCSGCDYLAVCSPVEEWYVDRFGDSDLHRMKVLRSWG
jgi:hypothetical protein